MNPSITFVLQFFSYDHLPPHLQEASKPFHELAHKIASSSSNQETTFALRQLLLAKDANVRAIKVHLETVGASDAPKKPE